MKKKIITLVLGISILGTLVLSGCGKTEQAAIENEGTSFEEDMFEFSKYEPILVGRGIEIDEHGATNVPGLYAAGDEVGNVRADIAAAAVFGRFAGEHSSQYIKDVADDDTDIRNLDVVKEIVDRYSSFLEGEGASDWEQFNHGIQSILDDYAGIKNARSHTLLNAGLAYLNDLGENAKKRLKVSNSHELMRAQECLDLLQIGKLICKTALERKETRGLHKRVDYPFTNPLLTKSFLTIRQEDGKDILEWREKR